MRQLISPPIHPLAAFVFAFTLGAIGQVVGTAIAVLRRGGLDTLGRADLEHAALAALIVGLIGAMSTAVFWPEPWSPH